MIRNSAHPPQNSGQHLSETMKSTPIDIERLAQKASLWKDVSHKLK